MEFGYDDQNIFARILRGEIPNKTVKETQHTLAFEDIKPQAPHHILVIPKGRYVTIDDFALHASPEETADFWKVVAEVASERGLSMGNGGTGFRAIANAGPDSLQEVPHFHLHILGGKRMGTLLVNPD